MTWRRHGSRRRAAARRALPQPPQPDHRARHARVRNGFLTRRASIGGGDIRRFDRDAGRVGVATDDLAYMLAMHWFPERHRRLERPRLDRRHAGLEAYGVRGCDRAALERDGQPSTRWLITRPVRRAADNILPVIWWNRLERAMRAVDDLDCRQRLQ